MRASLAPDEHLSAYPALRVQRKTQAG